MNRTPFTPPIRTLTDTTPLVYGPDGRVITGPQGEAGWVSPALVVTALATAANVIAPGSGQVVKVAGTAIAGAVAGPPTPTEIIDPIIFERYRSQQEKDAASGGIDPDPLRNSQAGGSARARAAAKLPGSGAPAPAPTMTNPIQDAPAPAPKRGFGAWLSSFFRSFLPPRRAASGITTVAAPSSTHAPFVLPAETPGTGRPRPLPVLDEPAPAPSPAPPMAPPMAPKNSTPFSSPPLAPTVLFRSRPMSSPFSSLKGSL